MNVRSDDLQCDPDTPGAWLLAWTKPRQESVALFNLELRCTLDIGSMRWPLRAAAE